MEDPLPLSENIIPNDETKIPDYCIEEAKSLLQQSVSASPAQDSLPSPTSQVISPGSCSNSVHSTESTPVVPYSQNDVAMLSIAQVGLCRIRRDARSSKVKLVDVVKIIGETLYEIAESNEEENKTLGVKLPTSAKAFEIPKRNRIEFSNYMWRIIFTLNKRADPCWFATDGRDISRFNFAKSESPELNGNDNSAMGRGLRCLLLALVYIDRICQKNDFINIFTPRTINRLVLAAIYLATKYSDDSLPKISRSFAKFGDVSLGRLSKLESAFCNLIDFEFYVTENEFQTHCMEQLRWAVRGARRQASKKEIFAPSHF